MMTLDEALQCADTFRQKESVPRILAAEVRRLQAENERLRENAKIISELEQLAARSNNDLLVENERLKSLSSIPPDCRTCANRGQVNGLSQESYCESCVHQGRGWRKNHFVDVSEMEALDAWQKLFPYNGPAVLWFLCLITQHKIIAKSSWLSFDFALQ